MTDLASRAAGKAVNVSGFRHEAALYDGPAGFVAVTAPFVRDGLAAGEAVMVMLAPSQAELLRSALAQDARSVHFVDMATVGRNPARIIPAWDKFVLDNARRGVRVRGVGEPVWPQRRPDEIVECLRHEALLNVAVDGDSPFWLRCPYDRSMVTPAILREVGRSHPVVFERGGSPHLASGEGNWLAAAAVGERLPEPPPFHQEVPVTGGRFAPLRQLVAGYGRQAGLADERTDDLVLAFSELANNSIEHGGGEGLLRIWHEPDGVVCEIHDKGHIADPLAGRRHPDPEAQSGRGLWIVNHLCDLVQLRSSAAGTVVRLLVRPG